MSFDYEYGYQTLPNTMDEEVGIAILVALIGIFAVIALVGVVFWVLRSFSLYTIAKRRGIRKPWLAWLPVGCDWILGSIADQYQHLVLGQIKSRRKILMLLSLVSMVFGVCNGIFSGLLAAGVIAQEEAGAFVLLSAIPSILCAGIGIAALVFYHMCNYDLYRSCDPKNAVAYLVIGIFISVTEPFFYLVNRRKDAGMSRRTAEPEYLTE